MKKTLFLLFSVSALLFASCGDKGVDGPEIPTTKDTVIIGGAGTTPTVITSNTKWTADKKYLLKGFVFVAENATLEIEAGTVIFGDKLTKGSLIITRGAKIKAEGTAEKPIVFTSFLPKGNRAAGDWGGIIILGKAKNNTAGGEQEIEGGVSTPVGLEKYRFHGGNDDNDNSGIMKYVRIEFAGVAYSNNNEINSLTLGSVGRGTTLSHIQVHAAGDDAFEWFGGTVNADHLVATKTLDDDLDTDNGFSGKVQFALIQRHPSAFDVSGSNGFESDNNSAGSALTPQTKAIFSNITVVGPLNGSGNIVDALFQHGAQIRRNSSLSIINSLFVGYPIGVYIDDTRGVATSSNYKNNSLVYKNNVIAGSTTPIKATDTTIISTIKSQNTIVATVAGAGLKDAFKFGSTPSFLLNASSPALSGADFTGFSGFKPTTYRGAFDGTNDWTAKWTNWNPENTDY